MKCIIVDDEPLACEGFINLCSKIENLEVAAVFYDPVEALSYISGEGADIVFLDVEMPVMNGLELGKRLQTLEAPPYIVYLTGYSEYAFEAFQVDALSYLLKPCDEHDIMHTLKKIWTHTAQIVPHHRVYIRAFGTFDVFLDGKILAFPHMRSKELLAILVDGRGGFVTSEKIMDYMFDGLPPDLGMQTIYRKSRMYLKQTLQEHHISDIVMFFKGGCSLDMSKIRCDYYDYLSNSPGTKDLFRGEYMTNYSWAENTMGLILFQDE